jgi:predicted nucleotidyltransferase
VAEDDVSDGTQGLTSADISQTQQDQIEDVKRALNKLKQRLLDKFGGYVKAINLLSQPLHDADQQRDDAIHVAVIVDDSDSERMTKDELHSRLSTVIADISDDVDDRLAPETYLVSDVWQLCYDGNYETVEKLISSATVYDTGLMDALEVSNVHKDMVLERFEKYIVTYVLAGSVVQGKATPESDIDVFVVIDDTDVKQMSRAELKDKLRAIITGMSSDAAQAVGVKNKLNIQVYILTDFWENVKQANPVIFTFLRDGVPLYDRGIFMAWKQLLEMGRIKPSPEAIEMFMNTGEEMMKKVDNKLKEIGMEDFFWATVTTSQAAIMLYGLPPPTPKETPDVLEEIFVDKEGFLSEEDIEAVKKVLSVRKDLEHGRKKSISGAEIDELKERTKAYLDTSQELFDQIQEVKNEERFEKVYDDLVEATKSAIRAEGHEPSEFEQLREGVDEILVKRGIVPSSVLHEFETIRDAKERYDDDDINKAEVNNVIQQASGLSRTFLEHVQRIQAQETEQSTIRLEYGEEGRAELLFLSDAALITAYHGDTGEERELYELTLESGRVDEVHSLTEDEYRERKDNASLGQGEVSQEFLDDLSDVLGDDVTVVV